MAQHLTLHERDHQISRYEVWQSMLEVQRGWRSVHESCTSVDTETFGK